MGRSLVAAAGNGQAGDAAMAAVTPVRAMSGSFNKCGLHRVFCQGVRSEIAVVQSRGLTALANAEACFAGKLDRDVIALHDFKFQTLDEASKPVRPARIMDASPSVTG